MVICPLILIVPEQVEAALQYGADVIHWNLEWLNSLDPSTQVGMRLVLAAAGLIVFLIGLLFLALELIRPRRGTVRLKDESGELMIDSISGHLAYHIDLLPDVLRVRPNVSSRGKSVRADLYVETSPNVSVPAKSAEIREKARQVIEQQLGLQIDGEIREVIKPTSYSKSRRSIQRQIQEQPAEEVPAPVSPPEEDFAAPLELPGEPRAGLQDAGFSPMEAPASTDEAPHSTIEVKADPHDI
jgi:hypothetical protein